MTAWTHEVTKYQYPKPGDVILILGTGFYVSADAENYNCLHVWETALVLNVLEIEAQRMAYLTILSKFGITEAYVNAYDIIYKRFVILHE